MEYYTAKEVGVMWGITARMVNYYCLDNRIEGAIKKGDLWLVPKSAKKPFDKRANNGRKEENK